MIGQSVSHYRIIEKIGSGGMGEIYLAEDTKLERNVALKFLPRHLIADSEARERFKREAKAAAALNHPNIVTIHEIGEHEGQVFIAMEYVEGKSLKELISENPPRWEPSGPLGGDRKENPSPTSSPLPLAQITDIAAQIASGLAAAHAKGIVHRDIKPQNIIISNSGTVKILDFGLAKLKGASPLTQESFTMGTVHYMSPEQGMGKEVDPRSDIWSLGVVLFQLVSGKLPFHGDYDQAVIYAILNEETPSLGIKATPAAAGMEKIIRRCLAKKRQERYPSAEALVAVLQDLNDAKAAPQPEPHTRRKLSRRTLLTTVSLLMLSGILGFLAVNPQARVTLARVLGLSGIPRARHMAVLPLLTSHDEESRALGDGFTAVIIDKLTCLEKFHDSLWTVTAGEVFENRAKPLRILQRLWGCNLFIQGDLQLEKNHLRLRLDLKDAGSGRQLKHSELQGNMANLTLFQDGLLSRLLQLLDLPEGPEAIRYANAGGTAMPGAYIQFLKGQGLIQDNKNAASIDRGIDLLERALKQDNRYLQARLALVAALSDKSRLGKDPIWLRLAEEQGRLLQQAAGQWAPAKLAWAWLLDASGKKAEALEALQQVQRLDPRSYKACISLANAYMDEDRTGEAENLYKQAIRLRPAYPNAYENLAYFYYRNGRYDEALEFQKKVTELAPRFVNGFNTMGGMYWSKGDQENARLMFERANAIEPNAVAQSNLATMYFFAGDYHKALPLFYAVARETDNHIFWGNLADTYRQLPEQKQKAIGAYGKAITLAEKLLASSPKDVELVSCLARYYAYAGEKKKALEWIARARSLAPANLEVIRRAILVYEAVQERFQALAALREYCERLGNLDQIEMEPDLAALCADPSYLELVGKPR